MTWARFDDCYTDHPKVVAAGPYGELVDMRAIIWCNRWGTDGHVPTQALAVLGRGVPSIKRVAASLVTVGRWEPVNDGWVIHDFLDYNPSRAESEAKHAAKVEAGRKGGIAKATARATASQPPEQLASEAVARSPIPTDVVNGQPQFRLWGEGWRPSDASIEWAFNLGFSDAQVDRQTGKFIAYNLAHAAEVRDANAAWRGWMRLELGKVIPMPKMRALGQCGLCDAPLQPGLDGELECSAGCEAIIIDLAGAS